MQFAASESSTEIPRARRIRAQKSKRLAEPARRVEPLDKQIWRRLSDTLTIAAGSANLDLLTVLTFPLRWPDWQMNSLYTRGFSVAGLVEPSNTYPDTKPNGPRTLHDLLDETQADAWNCSLNADAKASTTTTMSGTLPGTSQTDISCLSPHKTAGRRRYEKARPLAKRQKSEAYTMPEHQVPTSERGFKTPS